MLAAELEIDPARSCPKRCVCKRFPILGGFRLDPPRSSLQCAAKTETVEGLGCADHDSRPAGPGERPPPCISPCLSRDSPHQGGLAFALGG